MKALDAIWKALGFIALCVVLYVPFAAFLVFAWLVLPVYCAWEAIYGDAKTLRPLNPKIYQRKRVH